MDFESKKIWRYGDDVDTDVIIPARYLAIADWNELAEHAMEDIDTTFHLINLYDFTTNDLKSAKTSLITAINKENRSQNKDISIEYTININSITQIENGFYKLNVTAFYMDAEKQKFENHYTAIVIKENDNISVKSLTKLDN